MTLFGRETHDLGPEFHKSGTFLHPKAQIQCVRSISISNILYLYGRKDRGGAAAGKRQILAVAEAEVEVLVFRTLLRSRGIKDFKAFVHF